MWRAYKLFWLNYANFKGRTTRKEYWLAILLKTIVDILVILPMLAIILWKSYDPDGEFYVKLTLFFINCYLLIILIPNLSISVRRLADADLPRWLIFIRLIPFVGDMILTVLHCLPTRGVLEKVTGASDHSFRLTDNEEEQLNKREVTGPDGRFYIIKEKKSFYKRWWFWVLAILMLINGLYMLFRPVGNSAKKSVTSPASTSISADLETKESTTTATVEEEMTNLSSADFVKDAKKVLTEFDYNWQANWVKGWADGMTETSIRSSMVTGIFDYQRQLFFLNDDRFVGEANKETFAKKMKESINYRITAMEYVIDDIDTGKFDPSSLVPAVENIAKLSDSSLEEALKVAIEAGYVYE
ncbi:DUF805 domain-containing protein [Vagococcus sp. BWB3-3]|uniref:DUF805 domain-containing protein n=1 Tax=Vagococcus allomyrinae TaxID=2794353 RepID=A0A940PGI4_9ENTE|nr:DUF805 domain-containing protein [Vagococcus allomyrinae]MBP1044439.1 DUF805 domain-containing protein [Vagococcus allomyrinae]